MNNLKIGDIITDYKTHWLKYTGIVHRIHKNRNYQYEFVDIKCPGVYISWENLEDIPKEFDKVTELGRVLYE